MKNIAQNKTGAFTIIELLVVAAVIGILAVLALAARFRAQVEDDRGKCVGNERVIGVAFRVFGSDNDDRYPLAAKRNNYIVQGGAVGTQVDSSSAAAWQVAQAMWSELLSPKVFLCPGDRERTNASRVTDFNALAGASGVMTAASLGHPTNQDNALSYAFGVAADELRPQGFLAIDRNVNNVGLAGANIASKVAFTRTRAVLNGVAGPTQAVWLMGTPIHGLEGNIGLADGSVQQVTAAKLQWYLQKAATTYSTITNQNEILFP